MSEAKDADVAGVAGERDMLISAAIQVLQRNGWRGFKVESVLTQAGLSTRSFYRHFDKKADLLLAVLEAEFGALAEELRRCALTAPTPGDGLRAYIAAIVDLAYRDDRVKASSLFAAYWRELSAAYPAEIRYCTDRLIEPLADVIEIGCRCGDFRSQDPSADAVAIFHLVWSVTADQATLGGLTPREQTEQTVIPMVVSALGIV